MNLFSVERGSRKSLEPIANDLRLPGILSGVGTDGAHFVAILPTNVVVYRLLKHCSPANGPTADVVVFERSEPENGEIEALNADGTLKATGNAEGHFVIVDRRSGATIASFESQSLAGVDASGRYVQFARFSSDSRWLFVWGGDDNYGIDTEIYDTRSGRLLYQRFGPERPNNAFVAIQGEAADGKSVLLRNGTIVQLRLTDGSMPGGFATIAEGIIGAYLDDRGVYHLQGAQDARPCASIRDLRAIVDEMDSSSSWTKFAKEKLSANEKLD